MLVFSIKMNHETLNQNAPLLDKPNAKIDNNSIQLP